MRRILLILAAAALLFFSGCEKSAGENPSVSGTSSEQLPFQWTNFYYSTSLFRTENAQISLPDGASLRWNGSEYIISDGSDRSYPFLLEFIDIQPVPGGWNFINEYVLSGDPELTLTEYRSSGSGETVYINSFFCESAAVYGDAPEAVAALIQRRLDKYLLCHYLPGSVFEREISGSLETRLELIRRWSYSGDLLCEFSADGYAECFAELEDGSFLASLRTYSDQSCHILCCNPDGSIRWNVSLGDETIPTVTQLLVCPEGIYGFGTVQQENRFKDVYVCRISPEGQKLQERILGGTDYDALDWAEITGSTITIFGSTQCGDGDFPFSESGCGVDFCAVLSKDLTIQSASPGESQLSHFDLYGYVAGEPIFFRSPITELSPEDQLPEDDLYTTAIYSYGSGYVILRIHEFGGYPFQDHIMSYQSSYRQIVATGYDDQGNPLWQTVSIPFIG